MQELFYFSHFRKKRGRNSIPAPARFCLLNFDSCADLCELLFDGLSLVLGDAFLDLRGNAFNSGLRLSQTLACDLTDSLDDLDLLSAESCHNNVKLGLLRSSGSSGAAGSGGSSPGGRRNAEFFLKSMNQIGKL